MSYRSPRLLASNDIDASIAIPPGVILKTPASATDNSPNVTFSPQARLIKSNNDLDSDAFHSTFSSSTGPSFSGLFGSTELTSGTLFCQDYQSESINNLTASSIWSDNNNNKGSTSFFESSTSKTVPIEEESQISLKPSVVDSTIAASSVSTAASTLKAQDKKPCIISAKPSSATSGRKAKALLKLGALDLGRCM